MPTVKINGLDLYYEVAGSGERVVLTHGAWSDGRTWEAVVERMADRFQVVTWDRRGHSRSQNGSGPGSCRQDAGDLAALIRQLGQGPVNVVGNSAGGNVVLNLVSMYPELVRSASTHEPGPFAVLESSTDPDLQRLIEEDKDNSTRVEQLIDSGEYGRAARFFLDEVAVGPGAWDQLPEQRRKILEANAPQVPDDLRDAWDINSVDLGTLASLDLPLLVSSGTESPPLEAAAAEGLVALVPTARLQVLGGAGHIPHRTHPDEYAAMLTRFIDQVTANSGLGVADRLRSR